MYLSVPKLNTSYVDLKISLFISGNNIMTSTNFPLHVETVTIIGKLLKVSWILTNDQIRYCHRCLCLLTFHISISFQNSLEQMEPKLVKMLLWWSWTLFVIFVTFGNSRWIMLSDWLKFQSKKSQMMWLSKVFYTCWCDILDVFHCRT